MYMQYMRHTNWGQCLCYTHTQTKHLMYLTGFIPKVTLYIFKWWPVLLFFF